MKRPQALLNAAKFAAVTVPISGTHAGVPSKRGFGRIIRGYLFTIGRCGPAGRATKLMLQIDQIRSILIAPRMGSRGIDCFMSNQRRKITAADRNKCG
jgi:hypothetical protein